MIWLPLLEVDPDSVRAGWLPLLLVIGIGVLLVGLYLSMRHEMKKISVPTREQLEGADGVVDGPSKAGATTARETPTTR